MKITACLYSYDACGLCRDCGHDMAAGYDVCLLPVPIGIYGILVNTLYSTGAYSLTNGGPAGTIWVFLGVCVTMSTVVLSMAEMASMYVTGLRTILFNRF
jgi:hypothetical protein